ncbi:ABC transporter permease [Desulfosediminicola sp.]|uniref:ABC transporter permease n=1 Tax=Desulfosediminicola sp. TaxID=2886825 RepID=UPI003AF244C2
MNSFYLAWQYLKFNASKSLVILACITIIAVLPLALEILLQESERQLALRAEASPLLLGMKGSALDLVMNSLYFSDEAPEAMSMSAVEEVADSGLAGPIPMHVMFEARDFPIVGTSVDYFSFRKLELAAGDMFTMLGQCVIGAEVAKSLNLAVGDSLVSSPETMFDIAGVYPLKMQITGVLEPAHSPDDRAVFVDVKTAWVIQGLSHGHKDVTRTEDSTVILKREEQNVTANAKLIEFTEITEANIGSFHLHGKPDSLPLTAVLVVANDEKSGTILRGRYLEQETTLQLIRPKDVVDTLLATIFKIRNVLDAVILLVGIATMLALLLVFSLSLRLREKEIEVISKLGCSRMTTVKLLGAEIVLLILGSSLVSAVILTAIRQYDQVLVTNMFI